MPVHEKKLRQVLDYWPCETCLQIPSSEQEYLCSVCARLTRTIALRGPTGLPNPEDAPVVLDASSDALRKLLLTPDEWAELTGERAARDVDAAVRAAQALEHEMGERSDMDLVDAVHDLGDRVYPLERLDEAGLIRFEESDEPPDEELLEWEETEPGEPEAFTPTWEKEDEPPEPLPGSEASELAEKISRLAEEVRSMSHEESSRSSVSPAGKKAQGGTSSMAAKRKKAKKTKARKSPARKKAKKTTKRRKTARKTAKRRTAKKTVGKRRKTAKLAAKKRRKSTKKKAGGKKKAKRKASRKKK